MSFDEADKHNCLEFFQAAAIFELLKNGVRTTQFVCLKYRPVLLAKIRYLSCVLFCLENNWAFFFFPFFKRFYRNIMRFEQPDLSILIFHQQIARTTFENAQHFFSRLPCFDVCLSTVRFKL